MSPTIDYYLTAISPWTYLGHDLLVDLAARHDATIRWRPVNLPAVFGETGGLPLAKRAPARRNYRLVELQRWREKRGLPLNLKPAHFPTDPSLADRCAIALDQAGDSPAGFYSRAMRAVWVEDADIADAQTLERVLTEAGHDAASVLAGAKADEAGEVYEQNTREAVSRDVFGSPTYVLNGEAFWGQDRLELLADALASSRAPYLP